MRNIEQQPKQEDTKNQEVPETPLIIEKNEEELHSLFDPAKQAESIHQDLVEMTEQIGNLSQNITGEKTELNKLSPRRSLLKGTPPLL